MGLVAIGATFDYRRMLPEKRTTFRRMATDTGIVHCQTHQIPLVSRAMRAMTIRTSHLSLSHRMRVGQREFVALPGMAAKAYFWLRYSRQYRVRRGVNPVAGRTGYGRAFMATTRPCVLSR